MIEEDGEFEIKASTPCFVRKTRLEGALDAPASSGQEASARGRILIDVARPACRCASARPRSSDLPGPTGVAIKTSSCRESSRTRPRRDPETRSSTNMAALDPLTGVHARRFFEQWLRREVKTALRSQQPVSLIMLDMDAMKLINDTAGHLVGDQALATVGKVLRQACRENDVIGRYGGDEFAIVPPPDGSEGRSGSVRILELLGQTVAGCRSGQPRREHVMQHRFVQSGSPRRFGALLPRRRTGDRSRTRRVRGQKRGGALLGRPVLASTGSYSRPERVQRSQRSGGCDGAIEFAG